MIKLNDFFKILGYSEVVHFGRAQKNRKIDAKHVNDFLNTIRNSPIVRSESGVILVYGIIPVIVNPKTWHILDGQHRIEAFKWAIERGIIPSDAKILVGYWYIEDERHENAVTVRLNSCSKNWSQNDYIEAYSQDVESYKKLNNFAINHSLCFNQKGDVRKPNYRYAASIITGKQCHNWLKDGSFTCTDDQLAIAENIHEEMVQIREKLGLKNSSEIEQMAVVWHDFRNLVNYSDIVSMSYIPKDIKEKQIRNKKDWLDVFSRLYARIQTDRARVQASSTPAFAAA